MTHIAGRARSSAGLLVAALLAACANELAPTRSVGARLAKAAWTDTLAVAEIATLAVGITDDGQPITGVALSWASTDSSVATVSRAPTGGPGESLRAVVVGRAAGKANIVVRITQAGIATDSLRVPVVVRRSGSDSLTVGDTTTIRVTLTRTDPAWSTGAKVEWTSNDPSVAQVVVSPSDPTRATVTARASGRAQVAATVTSDRLERAVLQLPIRVGAVRLSPDTLVAAWPDTLTVTDTARLVVKGFRAGATVRWSSTNVAAFRVDANGGVTAFAQGGGEIVASVGEAGFQVAEFRKALIVQPLVLVERTPWASSINLANTEQFGVVVQDARGQTRTLPVTWRSTNETAFTVDASGRAVGKSRGGGELIASVGPALFQVSERRKSLSVLQKWSLVTTGYLHTCAIATSDRSAFCWGNNAYGELGIGSADGAAHPTPDRVALVPPFSQISAGGGGGGFGSGGGFAERPAAHTCGLAGTAAVFCWGANDGGQLGIGVNCGAAAACSRPLPIQVTSSLVTGDPIDAVVSGGHLVCASNIGRFGESSFLCWGQAPLTGPFRIGNSPVAVRNRNVFGSSIAAGGTFFCTADLSVECRGYDWFGPLVTGVDANTSRSVRDASGGFLIAAQLAAGGQHACALLQDARLVCWGSNAQGQLGSVPPQSVGGPDFSRVAVPVPLTNVRQLSAGLAHTCAVTAPGDAFCWGSNSHGQLGSGSITTVANPTPTLVAGGLKFLSVSAGSFHSCGVTLDGSLFCWGRNDKGQLGDGTTVNRLTPVRVGEAP